MNRRRRDWRPRRDFRMTDPITIRMGGYGPPTTGFSRALKLIGDTLTAEFGDRIDVKYVWNIMDFGYRAEDILWLVEDGVLTLGYQSSSYLTDRVPELGFVDLPFLFEQRDQARAAMDGALGRFLGDKIEERVNYRILGWFENGFRQISNRLRTVHTPPDLKDMRIRVLPSEVQARTFELLGCVPLRMDLTEAIDRIKAGTIDAQENPFANTVTYGVHKFHRFHTVTNHFYISRPIFLHRPAFDGWPQDLQRAMRAAIARAVAFQRELAIEEDRTARAAILAEGCEITELTAGRTRPIPRRRRAAARAGARHLRAKDVRYDLAALLVRLGQDQRPEHLVFRLRRIDRGDAHLGHVAVEHVGAVRRRIAPAGKRFRHGVVAGGNVLHRHGGIEAGFADAILERPADVVIELVVRRHDARLLAGKPHQLGIDGDGAKPVIAAIARDHRLRRVGVERGVGGREIDIKARLARRRAVVGAAAERRNAIGRRRTAAP